MYGLKSTDDISFLINACVSQIVVSQSALKIDLDKNYFLTIFSSFAVKVANQEKVIFNGSKEDAVALFPLIGDIVTAAEATASGGLQMVFQSGALLEVFDDSKQYESFTISNGDDLIVI